MQRCNSTNHSTAYAVQKARALTHYSVQTSHTLSESSPPPRSNYQSQWQRHISLSVCDAFKLQLSHLCVRRQGQRPRLVTRMCGKPKFCSDSVFTKPNRPKIWHPFRRLSDRTACKSAIYVKSDKKLLYLHTNVHIKNRLNTTETEISK